MYTLATHAILNHDNQCVINANKHLRKVLNASAPNHTNAIFLAILGALYLQHGLVKTEAGHYDIKGQYLSRYFFSHAHLYNPHFMELPLHLKVQHLCQKKWNKSPTVVSEETDCKQFIVRIKCGEVILAEATAGTEKAAKQQALTMALAKMQAME